MARVRKNKDDALMPPRVYMGRSAYELHPKSGGSIRLCDKTATLTQIWAAWEALVNEPPDNTTLAGLVGHFLKSTDFFRLAMETQKDYRKYSKKVLSVFGKMPPDAIKPEHIRQYMDKRGMKSHVQANREKAFMSRVYHWAYERGYVQRNPTSGVRQFKEIGRDRYITHQEYQALYSVSPDVVKVAMELAYLCCARQNDVLNMMKNQFLNEGILIKQSKTAVGQIKAWSPRLNAAIALASTLPLAPDQSTLYVLHQRSGHKYTRDSFNAHWRRAKNMAKEKYPELDFNFTFHDLKAKGISDLKGNIYEKQAISGHKNVEQTARYDRKIPVVPTVDGQ